MIGINDKIIIGTFEPAIEVYDIKKGELLWKFILKKKDKNLEGTIESIGSKSAKTPALEVLTEMSETINIIELKKSNFNNSFEGRYPVGTGGRPVNEIPLPFNTIKINIDKESVTFNNELGTFNLKGACFES